MASPSFPSQKESHANDPASSAAPRLSPLDDGCLLSAKSFLQPLPMATAQYAVPLPKALRPRCAHHLSKERLSPLCHHCNHIHPPSRVVIIYTAPLHRGLLLSSKCLLAFKCFSIHRFTSFMLQRYNFFRIFVRLFGIISYICRQK